MRRRSQRHSPLAVLVGARPLGSISFIGTAKYSDASHHQDVMRNAEAYEVGETRAPPGYRSIRRKLKPAKSAANVLACLPIRPPANAYSLRASL